MEKDNAAGVDRDKSLSSEKFIDVEKVIASKNAGLLKWMPGFLLSYIKRIVHEDECNRIMRLHGHLYGLEFVDKLIEEFGVHVHLEGEDNIITDRPIIYAANHPLGGLDGIALMYALGKYRQDIQFLVNDILLNIENLRPLFVPINKHGPQGRERIRKIEETYAGDFAVLQFPAGLVSRKIKGGKIEDLEWKKSFISKAKKYEKDIIPVFIEGKNSNFFYNLARLRSKMGIKANLEMFYLADEMFAQRGKDITIHIGKAVSYQQLDDSKTERQWAAHMKAMVYDMNPNKK